MIEITEDDDDANETPRVLVSPKPDTSKPQLINRQKITDPLRSEQNNQEQTVSCAPQLKHEPKKEANLTAL